MSVKFIPLGGADEIGASAYYINFGGTGILLDCGIHPNKTGHASLPDFTLLSDEPLDAVIISHAHQDHIGALPFLIKKFPHVKIFATPQTAEIALITLNNAVKITKAQMRGETEIYSHDEIDLLLRSVNTYGYSEEFLIKGLVSKEDDSVKIRFFDAGHILGSASVLIEYRGKRFYYTGDIKLSSQILLNGADLPGRSVDVLLTETTYGSQDTKLASAQKIELDRFAKSANKILSEGGSILIPLFSVGKMQEILTAIHMLTRNNKLTETYLYTGGISRKICRIYDNNKYLVKRNFKDLNLSDIEQLNYYDFPDKTKFIRSNGIVLATSGMMLNGTKSLEFAKFWLNQKKSAIFIVGYIDEDSPGYAISESRRGDRLKFEGTGKDSKVECEIKKFSFPTHSSRDELIEIVKKLRPGKIVLLHGEVEAKNYIGGRILDENKNVMLFSAEKGKEIQLC